MSWTDILPRGTKRSYPYGGMEPSTPNTPLRPNINEYNSYGVESHSPVKRFRADPEDKKEHYADHPGVGYSHSYPPHYPVRQTSISSATMAPLSGITGANTMAPPPQYQPHTSHSGSMMSRPIVPPSSSNHQPPSPAQYSVPQPSIGMSQFPGFSGPYNSGLLQHQSLQHQPLQYSSLYSSFNPQAPEFEPQSTSAQNQSIL